MSDVSARSSGSSMPVVSQARLGGDAARTRLVMDLDQDVDVHAFVLMDPYRVIVDLPQVIFRLSSSMGGEGKGLISAYRYGTLTQETLIKAGKSRIVIDTTDPVIVDKAYALPPIDGQPARLVIDLVKVTAEQMRAAIVSASKPKDETSSPAKITPLTASPAQGEGMGQKKSQQKPLIVLDPGHGGIDSGAVSSDEIYEKDIVLEFAKALQAALLAQGHVRVAMTRDQDVFVPLNERVSFARDRQASLFVSLHADALRGGGEQVHGATVYTLSETASDRDAAALAERENKADVLAGTQVPANDGEITDILLDLMHRETKAFSVHFAKMATQEMQSTFSLNKNAHRVAGFRVLRAPDVPSALIELGYMSSPDDVRRLQNSHWRSRAAQALAKAITSYVSTTRFSPQ